LFVWHAVASAPWSLADIALRQVLSASCRSTTASAAAVDLFLVQVDNCHHHAIYEVGRAACTGSTALPHVVICRLSGEAVLHDGDVGHENVCIV